MSDRDLGRVVLTLRAADGQTVELALHRRQGAARGLAHTRNFDMFLMNGANGDRPSDEALGLTVMSLARRIERNERAGHVQPAELARLVTHERWLSSSHA